MALDLSSLLLGLAAAGVPLLALIWQLQRKLGGQPAELALLNERLSLSERVSTAAVAADSAKRDDDGEFHPVSLTEMVSRN